MWLFYVILFSVTWTVIVILAKRYVPSALTSTDPTRIETISVKISLISITVRTTYLNWLFYNISHRYGIFWIIWFNIGTALSCIFFLLTPVLLAYNILSTLTPRFGPPVVVPVLPGVNIGVQDAIYIFIAVVLSSIVHEFGHAISSVVNDIDILDSGMIFPIPVFFVSILPRRIPNPRVMASVSFAGIWHNFILAVIAMVFLSSIGTRIIFLPLYSSGDGIVISHVEWGSNIAKHFSQGDCLAEVEGNIITGIDDFVFYLKNRINRNESYLGYCVNVQSALSDTQKSNHEEFSRYRVLAPPSVSEVLAFEDEKILLARQCGDAETSCGHGEFCVFPLPADPLLHIEAKIALTGGKQTIFKGPISDLFSSQVRFTDYRPRFAFFSDVLVKIPGHVLRMLSWMLVVSSSLMITNMLPIKLGSLAMDGFLAAPNVFQLLSEFVYTRRCNGNMRVDGGRKMGYFIDGYGRAVSYSVDASKFNQTSVIEVEQDVKQNRDIALLSLWLGKFFSYLSHTLIYATLVLWILKYLILRF